jgi:molybdate transport system substrate-binding protein
VIRRRSRGAGSPGGGRLGTGLAVALAVGLATVCAACSGRSASASPGAGTGDTELTIYAAASLTAVLRDLERQYTAGHPGVTITVSTDSSAALETKIEQGAPADVFLSADTAHAAALVAKGLAAGASVPIARTFLTVIVPRGDPAGVRTPADLARPGLKIVAAGDSVPITRYAAQLVTNLAKQPGYPSDFAAAYDRNVVSKEDNVAAVVAKVGLGEGDAAIVYATDAKASTSVAPIAVPDAANVPATYAGVVVKRSKDVAAARAFLAWLAGPDGRSVLATFGFSPPT